MLFLPILENYLIAFIMTYKVTEEGNISTVFLQGEIDMDVTDKAKEVIMPLVEAKKEVDKQLISIKKILELIPGTK